MVNDIAVQEFVSAIKQPPIDTNNTYSATVSRVDSEGVVWVNVQGGDKETPTASVPTEVNRGDLVTVSWRNNKLYIENNITNPSAGVEHVSEVEGAANRARDKAIEAVTSAEIARNAADSAVKDAEIAQESANRAQELAEYIDVTTYGSIIYYYTHTVGGVSVTETVYKNAEGGYYYLDGSTDVTVAEADLDMDEGVPKTGRATNGLDSTVENVRQMAIDAGADAEEASQSADSASKSAYAAIYHLSEVEKVVDVLNWLSKHGQYVLSTDTEYVAGKYYFTVTGTSVDDPIERNLSSYYELNDGVYVLTTDTAVDGSKTYYTLTATAQNDTTQVPSAEGWYELLSVDEAVSNYVSTHLALLDDGLWVQMDSDNAGARLQITSNGFYLHRGGAIIARYTDDIVLGDAETAHIKLSTTGGLEFYQGAEDTQDPTVNRVAYMSDDKLYIENSEITNSLRIGQFIWKIRNANRISFRYEPL